MKTRALLEYNEAELIAMVKNAREVGSFLSTQAQMDRGVWEVKAVRFQIEHNDDAPSEVIGVTVEVGPEEKK